jgi:ATP adenylyltransferase
VQTRRREQPLTLTSEVIVDDCPICAKHRGEGPLVGEFVARVDGIRVYHAPPDDDGAAPLGNLFIETDRHVAYVADLTPEEAAAVGRIRTLLARGLREACDAEFTFAAVIGTGVAHFHEHLVPRYADAPADLPWHQSAQAAPRADRERIRALADHLAKTVLEGSTPR